MEFLVFISTFAVYFAFDAFRHSDEFRFDFCGVRWRHYFVGDG